MRFKTHCGWVSWILVAALPAFGGAFMSEEYPESSFGKAPAVRELGVRYGYASQAVTELEQGDEEMPRPSAFRAPAGLETTAPTQGAAGVAKAGPTRPNPVSISNVPAAEFNPAGPLSAAAPDPSARKGVQEVALIAGDLGYFPKTLFVARDVPVRMFVTGASKNTLCIMMDSFQVRKQVRSQKIEEITFTPTHPGKYRFYCPVNGMEGTLIVKELTTSISAN